MILLGSNFCTTFQYKLLNTKWKTFWYCCWGWYKIIGFEIFAFVRTRIISQTNWLEDRVYIQINAFGSIHFRSPRLSIVTIPDFAEIWLKWSFLQQKWTLKISASYHNPFGIYPPLNFEQFPCFKVVVESIAHFCQLWVKIIFSTKFCSAWKLIPQ